MTWPPEAIRSKIVAFAGFFHLLEILASQFGSLAFTKSGCSPGRSCSGHRTTCRPTVGSPGCCCPCLCTSLATAGPGPVKRCQTRGPTFRSSALATAFFPVVLDYSNSFASASRFRIPFGAFSDDPSRLLTADIVWASISAVRTIFTPEIGSNSPNSDQLSLFG